jgi:hypothetical protein
MKYKFFAKTMYTALLLTPCLLNAAYGDDPVTENWVSRYSGPKGGGEATAIALDAEGNVYVTGSTGDYTTVKYDGVTGDQLWAARYEGGRGRAIALDSDGNVYVTGDGNAGPYPAISDYATIKYDGRTGTQLWAARYRGPAAGYNVAVGIAVDKGKNVYVTGHSDAVGGGAWGKTEYATLKYDGYTGAQLWGVRYSGPGNHIDRATAIVVDAAGDTDDDSSGGVYVTGYSDGSVNPWDDAPGSDYATIKYDVRTGAQLWVARYNGPGYFDNIFHRHHNSDMALAIALDAAGNVYVTGESDGAGGGPDYATVKYDRRTGTQLWVARYEGLGNSSRFHQNIARAIAVDRREDDVEGSVYVTGQSTSVGGSYDDATVKYDAKTGTQLWVARYQGLASECTFCHNWASAIAVDAAKNVYVTGWSGIYFKEAYATLKYDGRSGAELWVARYKYPRDQWAHARAIALDKKGNVYVTGGGYAYTIIRYSQTRRGDVN